MKRTFFLLFFLTFCGIRIVAQDFKVENFRENLTDLSSVMSGIKDLNNRDAALLRFSVRDNKFEFEPNLGTLKQEKVTGEVRLFIPEGTKRITIRHPQLGVLRDYIIEVPIKSRSTYDADIVITNKEYLVALFGKNEIIVQDTIFEDSTTPIEEDTLYVEDTKFVEDSIIIDDSMIAADSIMVVDSIYVEETNPVEETVMVEEIVPKEETVSETKTQLDENVIVVNSDPVLEQSNIKNDAAISDEDKDHKLSTSMPRVYAGVGYNFISLSGPSFHLGMRIKAFNAEIGYVIGTDKVYDILITYAGKSESEAYNYSCNKLWLRFGVNVSGEKKFKITPQAGLSFNMIKGKSIRNSSSSYFNKTNPVSVILAVSLSYDVIKNLRFHITPQYDVLISGDDVFKALKLVDNKLKGWGESFGINAGILYTF